MHFFSLVASAIAAFATVASAQVNPFTYPVMGETLNAGSVVTLEWTPTTPGTVSLVLRSGNSNALDAGTPIDSNIPNSGTYAWSIPSSTVNLFGYTVEIISDTNENLMNYTPAFTISGGATASASGSSAMSTAMSTASSASNSMSMSMTGASTMATSASATADATTSAVEAAGTVMATDENGANGYRAQSGFAAVAALVGVIAMI